MRHGFQFAAALAVALITSAAAPAWGQLLKAKPEPTHADVKYGPHERNVLDFYQIQSKRPAPLVVLIHGGGFVAGDKRMHNAELIEGPRLAGFHVASINYRFIDGKEVLFPIPQHDGARAVQFLRTKAKEWNIDPQRIACLGGSAGAGISLWIGFHDDLADPTSDDPVSRESTRIAAIGTFGGQSTYDPIEIKRLVGGRAHEHPSIFQAYGIATIDEALNPTPELKRRYDEASAITHLTKDDPPLFMVYSEPDVVPPADTKPGAFIHHPNFGKQLKAKMDELGIANEYVHTADAKGRNFALDLLTFLQRHLILRP